MKPTRLAFLATLGGGAGTLAVGRRGGGAGPGAGDECADALVAGSRRRFPNPVLATQAGSKVRLYDDLVRGRLVFVTFAYTRCLGSCPVTLERVLAAREIFARRADRPIDLVTLTLDPGHDTPEALARFVAGHGTPARWNFVTGAPADLERVRRFLGFTDPDPRVDADRRQHAALVAIGDDRSGRWQVASAQSSAEELARLALRTAGLRPA